MVVLETLTAGYWVIAIGAIVIVSALIAASTIIIQEHQNSFEPAEIELTQYKEKYYYQGVKCELCGSVEECNCSTITGFNVDEKDIQNLLEYSKNATVEEETAIRCFVEIHLTKEDLKIYNWAFLNIPEYEEYLIGKINNRFVLKGGGLTSREENGDFQCIIDYGIKALKLEMINKGEAENLSE